MNLISSIGLALTVVLLLAAGWTLRRASAAERRRERLGREAGGAGGARSRSARALSGGDRAAVLRSVRTGTRCADPELALAAADRAQRDLKALYSPWARSGWALLVASQACNASWIGLRSGGDLTWAGPGVGAALLVAAVAWWGWWAPHRCYQARRALALNRHGAGSAVAGEDTTEDAAAEPDEAAAPSPEAPGGAADGADGTGSGRSAPEQPPQERLGAGPSAEEQSDAGH